MRRRKAEDEAESAELRYDGEKLRDVCQQCIEKIKQKTADEKEKKDKKSKKKRETAAGTDTPKDALGGEGEAAGSVDGGGETKEGMTAVGEEEDEDALFGEDESVQCEELIFKYIGEIRRLYRNSCETDDTQPSPAMPPKTLPSAASPSLTASSKLNVAAAATAGVSAPVWCMSKVHLGRLVRKYKLLGKSCSAQFIDQLWDDKQASKRTASLTGTAPAIDGSVDTATAAAAMEGDGWINFDDFLDLLLRIATHKYSSTAPTLIGPPLVPPLTRSVPFSEPSLTAGRLPYLDRSDVRADVRQAQQVLVHRLPCLLVRP